MLRRRAPVLLLGSGVWRRQARVFALMKVPSHQVLAVLTAVGSAVFSGELHKLNSILGLRLGRELEQGILGEPRAGGGGTL